jgi:hypothetical protein
MNVAFIHGDLDDRGLTAPQFRVYGHIARRGTCYASAKTIAEHCRLSRNTVWNCLNELCAQGMLKREQRQGQATVFKLAPISDWHPAQTIGRVANGNPAQTKARGRRKVRHGGQRKQLSDHPAQTIGHKVDPIEVDPTEVNSGKPAAPFSLKKEFAKQMLGMGGGE